MSDKDLTLYIEYATALFRRHRIYQHLLREYRRMTTPAAIDRITAHAERVGKLMEQTDTAGVKADSVLNAYELSLGRFEAGVESVDEKRKALDAVLPAMGNAVDVMDKAFPDTKTTAAGSSVNGEQQVIKPEDVGTVEAVLDGGAPKSETQ